MHYKVKTRTRTQQHLGIFLHAPALVLVLFLQQFVFMQGAYAQDSSQLQRPPQFVMLAFDGSLNLNFWNESRQFARSLTQNGKPLHFTYFISGVYFLNDNAKSEYNAPHHGVGRSEIGFGGNISTIAPRVEQVNLAYGEGNEIASHANGHFDAGTEKWNLADWISEFQQFYHLVFDALSINQVQSKQQTPNGYIFPKEEVVGFRAPQLGITPEMYTTLTDFNFKYDTSKTSSPTYWPARNALGTWNFPLASLVISGTAKKTLSMDYNFYVAQSGGQPDLVNKDLYKKQMLDTYMEYFQNNYNGTRAPVHIGHHFSKWNDGAYWEAMKEFADKVCGMPEVHCVTYKEYMHWLESLDGYTYINYKSGNFSQFAPTLMSQTKLMKPINLKLIMKKDGSIKAYAQGLRKQIEDSKYHVVIAVDGDKIADENLSAQDIKDFVDPGIDVLVSAHLIDRNTGIEIARATQTLQNAATNDQRLDSDVFENRASVGDLPEAHREE